MIKIVDFNKSHIAEARQIIYAGYNEAKGNIKSLPQIDMFPDFSEELEDLANNVGVVMLDDAGKMMGFLCYDKPWDDAFGSSVKGTFAPIHAHGAIPENREMVYKRLYQATAEKWVANGVAYHAISFYAHDKQLADTFFSLGFGLRCIDAVRPIANFDYVGSEGISYAEIPKFDEVKIRAMRKSLSTHLAESPFFYRSSDEDARQWLNRAETRDSRVFIASFDAKPVAFIEAMDDGENFISDGVNGMQNICGAFCLIEHRGKGVMQGLLNYVITSLKANGYTALGVDFESINLSASNFWLKYFEPYAYSVVRRIDECAFVK